MDTLARQTAAVLAEKMGAKAVWLFGSYARGDSGPDSDLDFLVVVPESKNTRYERAVEARGYVSNIHVPKDIIVLTDAEWTADLEVVCSLANTVKREGIRLS